MSNVLKWWKELCFQGPLFLCDAWVLGDELSGRWKNLHGVLNSERASDCISIDLDLEFSEQTLTKLLYQSLMQVLVVVKEMLANSPPSSSVNCHR